jgi:hypothetical protein
VLEPRAREVMRELTIAVGRPMVHDLRAMYIIREHDRHAGHADILREQIDGATGD